jgi:hypothetical protein
MKNDRRKSKASAPKREALSIQFSFKKGDSWINQRCGVAFMSDDGTKLDLVLNSIPTNLANGHLKVWLEPYDEGK